ncbi:MAG TPA: prepilin-type N-terminal cleavage/methylation domain-containing protein [Candidatus Saccharimonadales bacterium]
MEPSNQRGDTLIEVLLAMVVLSIVIVGSSLIINVGLRNAINAVEHTQVRNVIAGQGETLRYLRDTAQIKKSGPIFETWQDIQASYANNNPSGDVESCVPAAGKQAFYLETTFTSSSQPPSITPRAYSTGNTPETFATPGRGMWIEAVRPSGLNPSSPPYIDFYIRACWGGLGTDIAQQSNSVVRLYVQ